MNQTSNNNEETENQKENAISKNHNYAKILLGYKKGRTNAWWENVITIKVPKSEWKDNFRMLRKSFYELCDMLRGYLEKKRTHLWTPISVEAQVGSFCIILATKVLIEKPQMLLEFLEHPFLELSEGYSMLSRHL